MHLPCLVDLAASFHQVPLDEEEHECTSCTCPLLGSFKWTCLAMGLTNNLSSFMRTMNKVFEKFIGEVMFLYNAGGVDDDSEDGDGGSGHVVRLKTTMSVGEGPLLCLAMPQDPTHFSACPPPPLRLSPP